MFFALTPILLFAAFILLLLISLSVPIIKTIYLFQLSAHVSAGIVDSAVSGFVKFGVWGYCISPVQVTVLGIHRNTAAECTKPSLGYTFDKAVGNALHVSGFENLISRTTTAALVLHPVACSLTFLALLVSLFMLRRSSGTSRVFSALTTIFGGLAALVTTVVFLIDVSLVAIVKNRIDSSDLTLNWGNAVWMALGATIAIWVSIAGACWGIIARRHKKPATY